MAKVVEAFTGKTKRDKYPWDEWLDGRIWRLEAKDLDITFVNFRTQCYHKAKIRGHKVRLDMTQDYVELQAHSFTENGK